MFSRLGVTANQTNEPLPEALDRLSAGKVDAVVVLGGEESPALSDFGADGRFHIVPIPWSPTLEPVYAPAHVTSADRPNLVSATEPVETVGEPMALVALDAAPGSPRAEALGRVARLFFDNYDGFMGDDRDSHWRDVNLAADASWPTEPWPRLRSGAKLAGREEVFRRRVSGGVPRLGQVSRRFGELAKRSRFGSAL